MKLSSTQKIIPGIISITPLLLLAVILIQVVPLIVDPISNTFEATDAPFIPILLEISTPTIPLFSIMTLALLIIYLIDIGKNRHMNTTQRLVWSCVIIFGGVAGYTIYWYLNFWKNKSFIM